MRSIRWTIALLITAAAAIAYLDRLALTPTWEAMRHTIRLSDNDFGTLQSLFFGAYALMYVGGGTLTDLLGTRRGFLLLVVCFSLACASHGLATGFVTLAAARLMLGLCKAESFRRGARPWPSGFRPASGATAMGMFNGGSAIGLIAAAPAAALVSAPCAVALGLLFLSGAVGLLWAGWWLWDYYPPAQHPRLAAHERLEIAEVLTAAPRRQPDVSWRQRLLSWGRLFLLVEIWGIVLGKFFGDAVWFTHSMWLPKYLHDAHGLTTMQSGAAAWIPYAASGVGSVFGGWCSSRLVHRGYSLNFSRKAVLGASAALMPCMCLITHVPLRMEIVLYSVAFFAHLFVLHAGSHPGNGHVPARDGGNHCWTGRLRQFDGRGVSEQGGRSAFGAPRPRSRLSRTVRHQRHAARRGLPLDPLDDPRHSTDRGVRRVWG